MGETLLGDLQYQGPTENRFKSTNQILMLTYTKNGTVYRSLSVYYSIDQISIVAQVCCLTDDSRVLFEGG